jgi:PhoPQ-activated pathogenicity-related protein
VPVYGCGFLHDNSAWLNEFAKMTLKQKAKWVRLWEPSMYIASASMPVFFVNGTNDFAYPLDSYSKTYGLINGERNFRMTVNMPHSHQHGWAPIEIGLFVDEHLKNGPPLPKILKPQAYNNRIRAKVKAETKLVSAAFHYTTGTGPINKRKWQTVSCRFEDSFIVTQQPPKEAVIWFLTVKDERSAVVSSEIMFARE